MLRIVSALIAGLLFTSAVQAATLTANVNCRASLAYGARTKEPISARASLKILDRAESWAKVDRRCDCWVAARYLGLQRLTSEGPLSISIGHSVSGEHAHRAEPEMQSRRAASSIAASCVR